MISGVPVMKDASSDARNSTPLATSRGWPTRLRYAPSVASLSYSSAVAPMNLRWRSEAAVVMLPGQTQLTPDVVRRQVEREAPGELQQRALRGVVRDERGLCYEAADGRDVDDRAAARGLHVGNRVLDGVRGADQVDAHDALPVVAGDVLDRAEDEDRRVVDQHVDRAERFYGAGNHLLDLRLDRHVGLDEDGLAAGIPDQPDGLLAPVDVDVGHGYPGALLREPLADGPPYAGPTLR